MAVPKIVERLMVEKKSWDYAIISCFGAAEVVITPTTKVTCLDDILSLNAAQVPDPMHNNPETMPRIGDMEITVGVKDIVHINYWKAWPKDKQPKAPLIQGMDGSPLKKV